MLKHQLAYHDNCTYTMKKQPAGEIKQRRRSRSADIRLERELQEWIVELVRSDTIIDYVDGLEDIERIVKSEQDPNKSPVFTIDHLARRKYAASALHALTSLRILDFIIGDANISRRQSEQLRPDVLAYNPEEGTLVLFELKKNDQTGRQALTELLAYEHELQNQVPLLGDLDIVFVLISPEWSTLMDHALSGTVTWSGKTCLGLEVYEHAAGHRLRVRIPDAWDPLRSIDLPQDALSTATLCLYANPSNHLLDGEKEDLTFREVLTAIEVIAADGERAGSHGFALLCDNTENPDCPWMIVIGLLDPFAFLKLWVGNPDETGTTVSRFFQDPERDYASTARDAAIGRLTGRARLLLSDSFHPELELFADWTTTRREIRGIAVPVYMEFWGTLGEFAREFVLHPGVRQMQFPSIGSKRLDWHRPRVGLPILFELTRERLFIEGVARCSDCFQLGVLLGATRIAYHNLESDYEQWWKTITAWLEVELVSAVSEIGMMYASTKDLNDPPPTLSVGEAPTREKAHSLDAFIEWVAEVFMGPNHRFQASIFDLGLSSAAYFDPTLNQWLQTEQIEDMRETARDFLKTAVYACLLNYREFEPDLLSPTGRSLLRIVRARIGLNRVDVRRIREETLRKAVDSHDMSNFFDDLTSVLVPLLDELTFPVHHSLTVPPPLLVDWEYVRQGVMRQRQMGNHNVVVALEPNGKLVTRLVDVPILPNMSDPENEVYFMNSEGALAVVRTTTWSRLAAGDFGFF